MILEPQKNNETNPLPLSLDPDTRKAKSRHVCSHLGHGYPRNRVACIAAGKKYAFIFKHRQGFPQIGGAPQISHLNMIFLKTRIGGPPFMETPITCIHHIEYYFQLIMQYPDYYPYISIMFHYIGAILCCVSHLWSFNQKINRGTPIFRPNHSSASLGFSALEDEGPQVARCYAPNVGFHKKKHVYTLLKSFKMEV